MPSPILPRDISSREGKPQSRGRWVPPLDLPHSCLGNSDSLCVLCVFVVPIKYRAENMARD